MDVIKKAIAYADSKEHEGAGYSLLITEVASDRAVEYAVKSNSSGDYLLFEWDREAGKLPAATPTFINPDFVRTVDIDW